MNRKPNRRKSTKQIVHEVMMDFGPGKTFHGYTLQSINPDAPMSGLHRLRDLRRLDKKIDYVVINHHASKYFLLWVLDEKGNKIKAKRRK